MKNFFRKIIVSPQKRYKISGYLNYTMAAIILILIIMLVAVKVYNAKLERMIEDKKQQQLESIISYLISEKVEPTTYYPNKL